VVTITDHHAIKAVQLLHQRINALRIWLIT
jgi:hypothetical protein